MADVQLERLESFRVFIKAAEEGAAIPPVAEHDLKRLHELFGTKREFFNSHA